MQPVTLPEYHQLPFRKLHQTYSVLIDRSYLSRPRDVLKALVQKHLGTNRILSPEDAHGGLIRILSDFDDEFHAVLHKHSVFFWIHLYRRIGLYLHNELGNQTDAMTLALVRSIAEQAIFKFARIQGKQDVSLTNEVSPKSILGGHFSKVIAKNLNTEVYDFYTAALAKNPQWVLTDFRPSDLANIYFIEGLAYQYWYVTAKLRSAGKGVSIELSSDGKLEEHRTEDLDELIKSIDSRHHYLHDGIPSNVGTFVPPAVPEMGSTLIFVSHNTQRIPMPDFDGIESVDHVSGEKYVPNYLPAHINMAEYYLAHRYLEDSFRKKFKFGFKELCLAAYGISAVLVTAGANALADLKYAHYFNLVNKLQRGYIFYGKTKDDLTESVLSFLAGSKLDTAFTGHALPDEIGSIVEFLSLDPSKQVSAGLWSLGPRYVLIPYQSFYFYDLSAWLPIFRNLFYGLRNYDPASKKGVEFEFTLARLARDKGLEVVLESKEITLGESDREVDVAVRVGSHLFVCECRASERPLNFEIGNPATIRNRCRDLQKKLDQANSLANLFRKYPKGSNYDVSWAKEITAIVVSPYVEWIWSTRADLWISRKSMIPCIMSAPEAVAHMTCPL
jgi:hypothetical protein